MAHVIKDVQLSKSTVNTGETVKLTVTVLTWDYLKKAYTWNSLKSSGMKYKDLKN